MIRCAILLTVAFVLTAVLATLQPTTKTHVAIGALFSIGTVFGFYNTVALVVVGKLFHGRKRYDELRATSTSGRSVIVIGRQGQYPLLDKLEPSVRLFFDEHARFTEPEQAFQLTRAAVEERRQVHPR